MERLQRFIWLQDKVIFSCKNQQLSRESHLSSKGITIHFNPLWILTLGFLRTEVPPGVSSPVFLSMVIDVFQLLLWHFLKYICVCGKHTRYNPIPALSRLRILLLLSWAHIFGSFYGSFFLAWPAHPSVPSHGSCLCWDNSTALCGCS